MNNKSIKLKLLVVIYTITFIFLFLYSFTQIDLGLVISRYPFFYQIEKSFQYIGYFQRPLSTCLYILILFLLTFLYILFLNLSHKNKLDKRYVWKVILIGVILLTFSYNAFSYDIFNYIFDAKIVTHYHANPYLHKALDYPGDPMLGFMHWTQRLYPYGPIWLFITVPLSFIGSQVFLLTFFLFKILAASSYIGSLYYIGKILQKIKFKNEVFGLVFFGLNPLVIIESLVSAHIDIVMMFFTLLAFYLLLEKKYFLTYLNLFLSIGIKFLTGLLLPIFIWVTILQQKKKLINYFKIIVMSILLLLLGVIMETKESGNFQPWYLLAPLSFGVFISNKFYVLIPAVIISVLSLILYIPFLFLGNWNPPVPMILEWIMIISIFLSGVVTGFVFLFRRTRRV